MHQRLFPGAETCTCGDQFVKFVRQTDTTSGQENIPFLWLTRHTAPLSVWSCRTDVESPSQSAPSAGPAQSVSPSSSRRSQAFLADVELSPHTCFSALARLEFQTFVVCQGTGFLLWVVVACGNFLHLLQKVAETDIETAQTSISGRRSISIPTPQLPRGTRCRHRTFLRGRGVSVSLPVFLTHAI